MTWLRSLFPAVSVTTNIISFCFFWMPLGERRGSFEEGGV